MKKSELLMTISIILGITSLLSMFLMHLALTDIFNNHEPDLTFEWNIVRIGFFIILSFIIISLITIFKLRELINNASNKK